MKNKNDSEINLELVAALISTNLEETQFKIALESLESIGLKDLFIKFLNETQTQNIWDAMREFANQHPDKLYVPCPMEPYSKFIPL